jgi:hypothetical protein
VPSGAPQRLAIDPGTAARLAYYAGPPMVGVLAPRGWHHSHYKTREGLLSLLTTCCK